MNTINLGVGVTVFGIAINIALWGATQKKESLMLFSILLFIASGLNIAIAL